MTYERDERVARITLDRPERGNGITLEMPRELKPGSHRAVATVKFTEASATGTKKMNVRFRRCVRRTAPAFTG